MSIDKQQKSVKTHLAISIALLLAVLLFLFFLIPYYLKTIGDIDNLGNVDCFFVIAITFLSISYFCYMVMVHTKIINLFVLICVIGVSLTGCFFLFKHYYTECKESLLEKSHTENGVVISRTLFWEERGKFKVYKIEITTADGYTSVHKLSNESKYIELVHVGNNVTVRISDDYPKLREVVDWKE